MFTLNPYRKPLDYAKSPMRYPGGKFYALPYIMPYIQCVPHDEYREPFFGGGAVFFAKEKVNYSIINDLESEIIDFYKFIQDPKKAEALIGKLDKEVATRERHTEVKQMIPQSELEAAFKTYYLNRTSYSGIIHIPAWGYAEGKSSPPQNWGKFVRDASNKLKDVAIYSEDYKVILDLPAKGSTVFAYLDPPYYHADTKRAYTLPFSETDHARLANDLKKVNYHFCLSYDDCEEVRQLYDWAYIYSAVWNYNTANRHGEKRSRGNELIITNYKVSSPKE